MLKEHQELKAHQDQQLKALREHQGLPLKVLKEHRALKEHQVLMVLKEKEEGQE